MVSFRLIFAALARYGDRIVRRFETPFAGRLIVLAVVVGVVGGLGAAAFRYMILVVTFLFFGAHSQDVLVESVVALPWYYRVLAPAIGGALVGLIIVYGGEQVSGHGVPEVLEAMDRRDGVIPVRIAPAKAVASAICIGSGGATGREGPIVQIGGTFGSVVGRRLELSESKTKVLLSAGAAAGIGGTFNAPLGGMIFGWEVLLGRVTRESIPAIAVASVVGTVTANVVVGLPDPIFSVPAIEVVSYWEAVAYAGLGLVGAVVALTYTNALYAVEDAFERLPVGDATKPALGGLGLGVLALSAPQVHATGYPVIQDALVGAFPLEVVLAFGVAKIVATSLTLGSGGSGGIFAPALFIGAMMGSAYGTVLEDAFPAVVGDPTTYAAVGMGAVFAGAAHAPLTAIVIVYELTGDVRIVGPLAIACLLSTVLSRRVLEPNIYTIGLLERGVDVDSRRLL
ncbi:chloride channel protein [Natrialbaceae archaeon AArc-T1-2]|uniref:chloride channel protein n=1 Tax=Natrialbaceae archaeon AArc-T1-2 TaxID=3053904 RepID=UPI00255AB4AD|nr:chloride channel protein [Natrialbaceae archaeon AArc-T1-2]WIV66640.1 chloride channel protein [Natrialbaceae archaeon AArc-T1-2]